MWNEISLWKSRRLVEVIAKLYNIYLYCYKGNRREGDEGQEVKLSLKDGYPDGEEDVTKEEETDMAQEVDLKGEKIVPLNGTDQEEDVMKQENMEKSKEMAPKQEKNYSVNSEESIESKEDQNASSCCACTCICCWMKCSYSSSEAFEVQFDAKTGR